MVKKMAQWGKWLSIKSDDIHWSIIGKVVISSNWHQCYKKASYCSPNDASLAIAVAQTSRTFRAIF